MECGEVMQMADEQQGCGGERTKWENMKYRRVKE